MNCRFWRLLIGLFLFFGATVTSCGLKYIPAETAEDLAKVRKQKLEQQLQADFATIGKKFLHLTYGETVVVKPLSYQRLDSLFEVKYQRSLNRISTKDLDPLIEQQKIILLGDTTEVLYMETSFFELSGDSTLEYVIARCYLNNRNVLRRMEYVSQFFTSKENQIWARKYMKEEWFTRDLGYTPPEDANFYSRMKNREFSLGEKDKEVFLENVFRIMRVANEIKGYIPQTICQRLALEDFKQSFPDFKTENFSFYYKKEKDPTTNMDIHTVEAISKTDSNLIYVQQFDAYLMPLF